MVKNKDKVVVLNLSRSVCQSTKYFIDEAFKSNGKILEFSSYDRIRNNSQLDDEQYFYEMNKDAEVFVDEPYSLMYEYFYNKDKNTKFILIMRDTELWVESFIKFVGTSGPMSKMLHNALNTAANYDFDPILKNTKDKENLHKAYENHNKKVIDFFKDKGNLFYVNINRIDPRSLSIELHDFLELSNLGTEFRNYDGYGSKYIYKKDIWRSWRSCHETSLLNSNKLDPKSETKK